MNIAQDTTLRIDFPAVQTRLTLEEEQAVLEVIRHAPTWTQGDQQKAFEKEFCEYIGCTDSVAVCSGTAALELAATLARIGPDDEVIVPAHTFVSTAVPFARAGAKIVFADIDPHMRVVSAETITPCISPRTKAIVIVHLYGLPADMDAILEMAARHGIAVIEDCAQSPGAVYKGRKTGSMGDFGCFSFQNQKNISTLGEGGMLTVKDSKQGELARKLRWMGHWPFAGERDRYWVPAMTNLVPAIEGVWPFNYCISEVQCAVGRHLLKRLDTINEERRSQADFFRDRLADISELSFQHVPEGHSHAYHLLSARYDGSAYGRTRDDLINLLYNDYGIKAIVQYWPLYRSDLFRAFGYKDLKLPNSDHFFDNMVSFPFWSGMPLETLSYMANRTQKAIERLRNG
jgi:dTDP-4-amino-4,6-dideoxygalactose transaminase